MNNIGIMIFIIILPMVLIILYINNRDKNKEPIGLLTKLFGLGMLSCLIALLLSLGLDNILPFMKNSGENQSLTSIFLYSFIGIATVEEISKWILLYIGGYKSKHFNESYDVIVYSVFVSLGFAFLENVLFLINEQTIDIYAVILRAISAVPGHACYGVFMGYYLSLSKKDKLDNNKKIAQNNILLSIIVPILLHGIYDFCLLVEIKELIFVFIVFMVGLYTVTYKKIESTSKNSYKLDTKEKYCKKCGIKVKKDFCPYCGKKI